MVPQIAAASASVGSRPADGSSIDSGTADHGRGRGVNGTPGAVSIEFLRDTVCDITEEGEDVTSLLEPAGAHADTGADAGARDVAAGQEPSSVATRQPTPVAAACNAGGHLVVHCERGGSLRADHVALCTGNSAPSPVHFVGSDKFYGAAPGRYINNPWTHIDRLDDIIGDPEAAVALIGSRLTAVDCLLTLKHAGHRGPIRVISRTGQFPRANPGEDLPPLMNPAVAAPMLCDPEHGVLPSWEQVVTLRQDGSGASAVDADAIDAVFQHVMDACDRAARQEKMPDRQHQHRPRDFGTQTTSGYEVDIQAGVGEAAGDSSHQNLPWQSAVDSLRPVFNTLWLAMSTANRARFLTRWRGAWETRRHRMAPDPAVEIEELMASRQVWRREG